MGNTVGGTLVVAGTVSVEFLGSRVKYFGISGMYLVLSLIFLGVLRLK